MAIPNLPGEISAAVKLLEATKDPGVRFATACRIMAKIRGQLTNIRQATLRLAAVDTSLAMEIEQYTAGRALMERLASASRRNDYSGLGTAVSPFMEPVSYQPFS